MKSYLIFATWNGGGGASVRTAKNKKSAIKDFYKESGSPNCYIPIIAKRISGKYHSFIGGLNNGKM